MTNTHVTLSTPAHVAHDVAVDAVLAVDGHGFAETSGHMDAPGGFHAFASVSRVTLMNLGEGPLAQRFEAAFGDATLDVHVTMDERGLHGASASYGPTGLDTIAAGFEAAREAFDLWHDDMMHSED